MDVSSKLDKIKNNIRASHDYFKINYDRFNKDRSFLFDSNLTSAEITLLQTLSRPQLEFNVLEAYISRLLGEFSKQEPDIEVSADDENTADPLTIRIIEQHLRHTLSDANCHNVRYRVYKDLLSGGFSVFKICTDYANSMSFNQVIQIERAFDPTMCGFDTLAKEPHKGDGRYAFELFPMSKERFKEEYPDVPLSAMNFRRDLQGFNWSYLNDKEEILVLAEYYEKKTKKMRIVQLRDGRVMPLSKYEKMQAEWDGFEQMPLPIGKPRTTEIVTIDRYRLIENEIIEHEETDFSFLPLVFVDGNSEMIRTPINANVKQLTKSYIHNAIDAQRFKNYAGISWANAIENEVQHKFIVKKEAIPKEDDFLAAIKDPQKASTLVVNAFFEQDPNQQIPDPIREVAKVPMPPEVSQAFLSADNTIQMILGSYDQIAQNNSGLSGRAIEEGALQTNSASLPYIVGFMQGFQRIAQIYVDLLPKYYTTPRTIPIVDEDGMRQYVKINGSDGVNMFYDSNALNVTVKAGASFQVQKSRTIMMVKEMMGMSPRFAEFISEKGLNFVLDNMEGRSIEQLKKMVGEWTQELQQQKQVAMQQQEAELQQNPILVNAKVEMLKIEQKERESQRQYEIDIMSMKLKEFEIMAEINKNATSAEVQSMKANAEVFTHQLDAHLKIKDQDHRHVKEALELHHKVNGSEGMGNVI